MTIVRKGIPGDTADNGLYRLCYDILEYNPDCVLIQYAINDAFMGYTSRQFRSTIQEIIEEIQADGDADIVLVTSSYIGDNADAEIIDEFHRQLEEIGTLVQYDMVHPTEDGYRFMAEALVALF
ncbi:MAG: acyl-CoA thioesterase [Thermodesulfobacteriota bacterium]|nr:acyl-CoA thioesterase [Thermodesulfobacteriota bacterium]